MISYLIGQPILEKDFVTVLCGQVGYAVRVTEICRLSMAAETEVRLHIYTHVKEEALELYGFKEKSERELFLLLIGVSGVGPKTGLALLNLGAAQFIHAVQQADTTLLSSVPRVGKKLAQKIIIELRTKLGAIKELNLAPLSASAQEAQLALLALGFGESEIHETLQVIDVESMTTANAVKEALKLLQKG